MMKEDENNQNEENNICGTYKYNKDINESLDNSSFLPGILKRSLSEDEKSIKKIIRFKSEDFNNINPLRDVNRRKSDKNLNLKSLKEKAIMESVVNLKVQYILYNIRDFIRKYQINANPNINAKLYKILLLIRNISLMIYGIIIFFEKPWFCYEKATIPLPTFFNFKSNCDNIAFLGLPFIDNKSFCIIEITLTLIFFIIQLVKYKSEYFLKNTNIGVNKIYNIIQTLLFVSLLLCIIDLIIALIKGSYPIVNFILRAFIYIYMIRRIRRNWVRIGKILWRTKTVFLFLFMNIFFFSMIGYILFKKESGFFNSFHNSFLQLYILLSTCNFPDIMIDTFNISKFSIFYFIFFISINYFILLSYLKTLYYTKYYLVNKEECLNIIKYIIQNEFNKDIFKVKEFKKFIYNQKYLYSLNEEEYNNILIILNIYDKNNELFIDLTKIVEKSLEQSMVSNTLYGNYILKSKIFEIIINIICFITLAISIYDNVAVLTIQFVWSFLLLLELYTLIKNLGIKRFFFRHINRVIFHIFNIIIIISIIYLIILDENNEYKSQKYNYVLKILEIFLSLRTIRVFVFLDKFKVIKKIYTIIRNSKEMFYRNLFTLYSLFLLFSTFSILLTGGNIEKNSFDNKVEAIPENYAYINFNDFPSSFISCFCLLMINNLNILVKSLTFHINSNQIVFQFYFATFYFFSTLIIINIIQTLLLEFYLNSNYSDNNNNIINNNDNEKEKKDEKENKEDDMFE